MMTCIGEPVSWLRLEELAMGVARAGVAEHVHACPACKHSFESITSDVVALPPLVVPAKPVKAKRRWWLVPAYAACAAAIVLFVLWRSSGDARDAIKGGDVSVGVIRERAGTIRDDAFTFAPGDRFKVVVTCPPRFRAWVDVAVVEAGASTADFPVEPAAIACGNRVVIPGAFVLTTLRPHRVCVHVASGSAPARTMPRDDDEDVRCVTLTPE